MLDYLGYHNYTFRMHTSLYIYSKYVIYRKLGCGTKMKIYVAPEGKPMHGTTTLAPIPRLHHAT
jgi:hypothetical protein